MKTYPDKAAYDAAVKSKMESTVGLIENTGKVVIDGVNVVTANPKVGDVVCYDENRKVRFIALDTFEAGTFPVAWETVGVVVLRKGNKVTICSKYNESKKFMEVYPYIVGGYTLDGSEHTAQLRLHGRPGTDTWYEFRYTASTDSEFVAQLKQFLTDNGETDWSAYQMDGKVYLQYDNYTSIEWYNVSCTQATGLTLTAKVTADMPEFHPDFWRKCGNRGLGVWHTEKAKLSYKSDSDMAAFNPSSDISSVPSYPVCWPAFAGTSQYQDDHCHWLRQKYCKDPDNPKIEEWERYIDSLTHLIPYEIGGHAPKFRDGKTLSDMVKNVEYQAADGIRRKLYQGIDWCTRVFEGNGYMPSLSEFVEAFGNIIYGLTGVLGAESDPVNRSLNSIGGYSVSCMKTYHTAIRSGSYCVHVACSSGIIDNYYFHYSLTCVPFADIDLSELAEY